jgi:asparagine synthase (glutamine-hydrolysing)
MCGIAGFVSARSFETPGKVLERMTEVIHHRGPDQNGYYRDALASLGHLRLSIIDLSTGQQPMCNEDGSRWIVYNGEVFNHRALRPALENAGHVYKSRCDTETILHAYEEYGTSCVSHFRGMFAFAIWDKNARRLFCARDRMGIKPFYYYWDGKLFAFASEIKALLEHPAISAAIEESAIPEYLAFGYLSDERTFFRGIKKLMPGHVLVLSVDGETPRLSIEQYWDVPYYADMEDRSDESWIREFRQRLEETIEIRLMSDVPLGMFLSGGLDSSAIAALMGRMAPQKVKTFAVGYQEESYSELGYARRVAERLGTDHHEIVVGMDDFMNAVPRLVWHEDEPIFWPASVSLYFVSKLAQQHVKVVLTGEGSDELLAGYDRYTSHLMNQRAMRMYRMVPGTVRNGVRNFMQNSPLFGTGVSAKLRHLFAARHENLESMLLDNFYCAFPAAEQSRLLAHPKLGASSVYRTYLKYWDAAAERPLISRMLYADLKAYLVELLMKQDQMSMACSLESRVPFLDHTFVEFAMRIPEHMKIRGMSRKYILKKAVEDVLPHDIIYRKKMGFPTPFQQWMSDPRAAAIFKSLRSRNGLLAEYLDPGEVDRLLDHHERGICDATDRIWRLLNLHLWGEIFLRGKREELFERGLMQSDEARTGLMPALV